MELLDISIFNQIFEGIPSVLAIPASILLFQAAREQKRQNNNSIVVPLIMASIFCPMFLLNELLWFSFQQLGLLSVRIFFSLSRFLNVTLVISALIGIGRSLKRKQVTLI